MKRLLLVGAGDFGREIYGWCLDVKNPDWVIGGFLDDNLAALQGYGCDKKIIAPIQDYQPQMNDIFLCTIGHPATRLKVGRQLQARGAEFINFIHPSALVNANAKLGAGIIIGPFCYIATHATLGDFVMLNVSASVGHDAVLNQGCTLSSYCDVTGHVTLGERVFMGSHACIIPNKKVGDDAIIGAGSAVMRNVVAGSTVVGVPAKKVSVHKS